MSRGRIAHLQVSCHAAMLLLFRFHATVAPVAFHIVIACNRNTHSWLKQKQSQLCPVQESLPKIEAQRKMSARLSCPRWSVECVLEMSIAAIQLSLPFVRRRFQQLQHMHECAALAQHVDSDGAPVGMPASCLSVCAGMVYRRFVL